MSVAFYIHRSLCAVYKDTGRMDLRDMVAALEAMQLDLLSMSYEPEDLDPDSVMRMQVAQQTLLRAVELLRAAHEQEYGHSDGKILL
jgi:hypothetical protein